MTNWQALVNEHGPMVWRTASRLLNDDADAADCFQETFIAAVRAARKGRVESWAGLLRRIATVRALDRLRERTRRDGRIESAPVSEALAGKDADPSSDIQARELADKLRHALALLPPRQAEVFCLRFVDGLSYEELGELLGLSANAVGVLLHKARRRLRKLLATAEVDERG
jgi:RNA polymerase sigma-70 factor (ECF subfamily)